MSEINELRNKLIELQTESADVRVAIEELQVELDKVELDKLEQDAKARSREAMLWPRAGDYYWHVDSMGLHHKGRFTNNSIGSFRLATGNCHRTKAEALAYREWQTDPRVVARGMIERQPGFDPRGKWVMYSRGGKLKIIDGKDWEQWGVLSFVSVNALENAIEDLGEGLFLVALGVITGEEAGRIVREEMGK